MLVYTAPLESATGPLTPTVIPYAESFESYPPGTTIVDMNGAGIDGWFGKDASTGDVAVVQDQAYSYAGEYPIHGAGHSNILSFTDSIGNRFSATRGFGNVWVDFMCQPGQIGVLPSMSDGVQFAFLVDTNGRVAVWHASYSDDFHSVGRRWTELAHAPIATGEWVRVTVAFDYLYSSNSAGEPVGYGHWFRIRVNGGAFLSSALAYKTPTPAQETEDLGGTWFLCADNAPLADGPRETFFPSLGFDGIGSMDDLVVTNGSPYRDLPPIVRSGPGATGVADTSATLNGTLVSTGGAPATVWVCWGTSDGGTSASGWANTNFLGINDEGPLSTQITGLTPGAKYYYRFFASNAFGTAWAGSSVRFETAGPPMIATEAASGIGPKRAAANGSLISTGGLPTQVWLFWGPADGQDSIVAWANTNAFGWRGEGPLSTNLAALDMATTYYYRFAASNAEGFVWADASRSFRTPSAWRFAVVGDSGDAPLTPDGIVSEIAAAIAAENVDLMIFPGDLGPSPGSVAGFQQWTNVMAPLYQAGIAVYPVRGNHEGSSNAAAYWRSVFGYLPTNGPTAEIGLTYSFTNMNALFIGLDELVNLYQVNQNWLNGQLASNTYQHVFVFGHMPAFPTGGHIGSSLDVYPPDRNMFWSALEASGARAYFCGHEHFYDHARVDDGDADPDGDVHQFIVGTGGSSFYADQNYLGNTGSWALARQCHTNQYGYILGEVKGERVTLAFKHRTAQEVFQVGDISDFGPTNTTRGVPWSWMDRHGLASDLADDDKDGMDNLQEYLADTDPTNSNSRLQITGIQLLPEGLRIGWQGGTSAWQYLQRRYDLLSTGGEWTTIFTNPLPMSAHTNILDPDAANPAVFYRIRAVRP